MKEEFKWYAGQCEGDEPYMVTFINKENEIGYMSTDFYDSDKYEEYIKNHVKEIINIIHFPSIYESVAKLVLDMFELKKRMQNIK